MTTDWDEADYRRDGDEALAAIHETLQRRIGLRMVARIDGEDVPLDSPERIRRFVEHGAAERNTEEPS